MSNPVKLPFDATDWKAWLGMAIVVVAIILVVRRLPLIPGSLKP